MKKMWFAFIFALCVSGMSMAHADVKIIVHGDTVTFDTSGFPPSMQKAYELMLVKCNQCHTIERIVASVQTGVCPLSKTTFSKETTKSLVTRMYLKDGANMTREDARSIILLLNYLLDQKVTVVEKK